MSVEEQFETFWQAYPRRQAKGAARAKFKIAIKKVSLEKMLAAIDLYIQNKKDEIDYCHPATWLHQERWEDEWEVKQPTAMDMFGEYVDGSRATKTQLN